jgi:DNA-binding NarL/FixJ family response regulator
MIIRGRWQHRRERDIRPRRHAIGGRQFPEAGTMNPEQSHCNDAPAAEWIASVQIGVRRCRIVCVDNVVPRHVDARHTAHPRQIYADGEIAHFELDQHRYALVSDEPRVEAQGNGGATAAVAARDLRDLLTNREMQIVQLICLGCLTKQVADRLHLSEFTVRSYLKTIYCKLGVRSRGAMVFRYAQAFSRVAREA